MTMGVHITDHALIRYIERVYGLDLTPVRQELARQCREAAAAGATKFIVGDTVFVFAPGKGADAVVTTIKNRKMESIGKQRRYEAWQAP